MKEGLFNLESKGDLVAVGSSAYSQLSETSCIYIFQLSNFHFFLIDYLTFT